MRAAALVITAMLAAACGGGGGDAGAWLLVRREVDGVMRLAQVPAGGGDPRLVLADVPGEVTSAVVLDGGAALLVAAVDPERQSEVWRVETQPYAATRVWTGVGALMLEAASRDGKVALLPEGRLLRLDESPARIEDLAAPKGTHWRGSDLSPDGKRVLVSFGPDCKPGMAPHECRLEVWAFDRAGGWRVFAKGETSHYNPRFVPGSDGNLVVYHRAIADPSCPGPWACRDEEIVAVGFDGADEQLVRAGAWTPRLTRDGRRLAVATVKDHRLLVGERGGELTEIAADARFVMSWSANDQWIAYWPEGGDSPTALVRRDGTGQRVLDDGIAIGWLARPLPTGDVPPRKKTDADHLADAMARARGLARAGETVASFDSHEELRRALAQPARTLVVIPRAMLCALLGAGDDFVVIDDADAPYLVIASHVVDDERDVNPHREVIRRDPPLSVGTPVNALLGAAIELRGVEMPARVKRGESFEMTLHYKALSRPGRWKVFVHFDGGGIRFQGDHEAGECGTDGWDPDDYVVDRFEVKAGSLATPAGEYQVWTGFFRGGAGGWENMPVDGRTDGRVLVGTITVE